MDITQLRAFVAVAHEGNLTRAAEKLHVTQPAVSLQIKSLQAALELQLFNRNTAGMSLTEDGAKLLPYAERVLAAFTEFRQGAEALHTTISGSLALGTILDPEFTRLGQFLKRLVENYPQISTELRHGMSGWVAQEIKAGRLDLGFYLGTGQGTPGKEFHSEILTSFTYNVVAPQGWKARVAGKDWPALAKLPWIWTPAESVHQRLLNQVFSRYKVTPNRVAMVDQEPSMLDLVKSGAAYGIVAQPLYEESAKVAELLGALAKGETVQYMNVLPSKVITATDLDPYYAMLESAGQ